MISELQKNNKIKMASYFAVIVSSLLCFLKFFNVNLTHSHALNISAIDSYMDLFVSLINSITVYVISFPINNKNPKGYDKLTSIITLFQSIIILIFSIFTIYESIEHIIINNNHVHNIESGIYIIFISLLINIALVFYQKKVINETGSIIIKADMIHYSSDIFSNTSLLIGMIFIKKFHIHWLDSILALIFALYLLISLYPLIITAIYSILDLNYTKESNDIYLLLKKNDILINKEDISVFFSGIKFIIEIKNQNIDTNEKISKIINLNINNNNNKENTCCSIGCSHISNALTKNISFKVIFIS